MIAVFHVMANHKASIWVYRKTDRGWRYCKPQYGRNNKLKPEEGRYYVRHREGTKTVWTKCEDAADAVKQAEFQTALLAAVNNGIQVKDSSLPIMMSHAMPLYLEEYKLANRPRSYALMKQTLEEFNGFCRKNIIGRITRLDLLRYRQWLIDKGRTDRTASNKMLRVGQFIRSVLKIKAGEGLVTEKDGKYVELEPEIYTQDELDKLFAACNSFQKVLFQTYLMSGLRKKELESLEWKNLDLKAGTLKIEAKPGFSPKTWEERTVEIPKELIDILKEFPHRGQYVFATGTGGKFTHSWDECQKVAEIAELENCFVHKFRATYATRLLHGGLDLKTVQKLCGWNSLESAMRYLAKAKSSEVRAKVDAIWGNAKTLTQHA